MAVCGRIQANGNEGKKTYSGRQDLYYQYRLQKVSEAEEYAGRMYISFKNSARNFIRHAETIKDELIVIAISPAPLSFEEFPGYRSVILNLSSIGAIVSQGHQFSSWQTALSVVKGIYVLSDRDDGKLYVGKADGNKGFWGRW